MLTLTGIDEVKAHVGKELGVSEWHEVTQEAINEFADVTGDHQFIHVDPERAKETPFGGTIAHGYYTLSCCRSSRTACSTSRASRSASTTG
jgi:acyl dehydratase